MYPKLKHLLAAATAIGCALAVAAAGTGQAASTQVLFLKLNDAPGASVARDASGQGHGGRIGSHVTMTGRIADWDRHPPSEGISYGRQHLITIPDAGNGSLDPGRGNFSISMRFRTSDSFGNVLQKGQATTPGGQVKLQIPKGRLTCMFKTASGTATAGSGKTPLNDNAWHIIRCDRTPTSVTMYVDGVRTGRSNHATGNLNNTKPWSIGGKAQCNGSDVTCDYFAGEIDWIRMSKG